MPERADFIPAQKSAMPLWISAELARLVDKVPEGDGWLYEYKFDGYRILIRKDRKEVKIYTRNRQDWTDKFPFIVEAVQAVKSDQLYLDGELVAINENGVSDFQLLQNAIKQKNNADLKVFVFDLMYMQGFDLRLLPLIKRKILLKNLFSSVKSEILVYSNHTQGSGKQLLKEICRKGLEGIICKNKESLYVSERTSDWLKVKCQNRQEFLIVGFTPHSKRIDQIGALLLGSRETRNGKLIYRGKVGTGFNDRTRRELYEELSKISQKKASVKVAEYSVRKSAKWTKPIKIAEIEYREITKDGQLRQASYKGLRLDKDSKNVIFEKSLR